MNLLVLDILIAVAALALFGGCLAAALLLTRPARPRPAAPTPELGEESPAVVNLVANGWELNEDAVEATLLDLAARRHIELRQTGSDPRQTTVHLRSAQDAQPGELTPYEQRVLERVRGLAVRGVVPISALTFRDADQEKGWEKHFRSEVITDAKARGLTRRRFDGPVISLLEVVAGISAVGLAAAMAHYESWGDVDDDSRGAWVGVGFFAFIGLSVVVGSFSGQRHTEAGVEAARRWGGVRAWLHGHEKFADLPPASVMVWDRYLAYGAALGVTHVTSDVLDLGMADRKRVWSSYGSGWHRVRVRYPRRSIRYGRTSGSVIWGGVLRIAFGVGLIWLRSEFLPRLDEVGQDVLDANLTETERIAGYVLLALGVYLLVRGGYWLLRGLIDLGSARAISGEVLWYEPWMSRRSGNDGPVVTTFHYLAVDDGSSDKTTAWALPAGMAPGVAAGDTVTIEVRPWTRRVMRLERLTQGSAGRMAEEQRVHELVEVARQREATAFPPFDAGQLLTEAEVGQALGATAKLSPTTPLPGFGLCSYFDPQGRLVLRVQLAAGTTGRWMWRMRAMRGSAVPGIGDKARLDDGVLIVKAGELCFGLALDPHYRHAEAALPELGRLAVSRLPVQQPST